MLSNNVTLIGNLGSDIEVRQTPAGQNYCKVDIAVTRVYTDRNKDVVKDTQWFRLIAWARQAERMAADLSKGAKVLIEGSLSSSSYTTKDGQKREVVEINVASFQKVARKAVEATKTVDADLAPAF